MIKFNQTISMLECLSIAHQHITKCIDNKSSGVAGLDNKHKVLNRIADHAVNHFVKCNYFKVFKVECEHTSYHYGLALNTELKKNVGMGELNNSEVAALFKDARQLIQNINQLV